MGHPLSRRAPGTDAGRTLRDFSAAEGEGVEPSRLIATRFQDGRHRHIGLPFQKAVGRAGIANRRCSHSRTVAKRPVPRSGTPSHAVGRAGIANRRCSHSRTVAKRPVPRSGTPSHAVGRAGIEPASYGLRDRCNPAFATDPLIPPDGEPVGMGCWRHPCLRTVELSENTSVRSGPRSRTRISRFRAARPAIGPVRITGRRAQRAAVPLERRCARWRSPETRRPPGFPSVASPRLCSTSRSSARCGTSGELAEAGAWLYAAGELCRQATPERS